jgi:hypothetical protein
VLGREHAPGGDQLADPLLGHEPADEQHERAVRQLRIRAPGGDLLGRHRASEQLRLDRLGSDHDFVAAAVAGHVAAHVLAVGKDRVGVAVDVAQHG